MQSEINTHCNYIDCEKNLGVRSLKYETRDPDTKQPCLDSPDKILLLIEIVAQYCANLVENVQFSATCLDESEIERRFRQIRHCEIARHWVNYVSISGDFRHFPATSGSLQQLLTISDVFLPVPTLPATSKSGERERERKRERE